MRWNPIMVMDTVWMMKKTMNPALITPRTLAADTGETVALSRSPLTRRIVKGRMVFLVRPSPIVAEGIAQMTTRTVNPTSVTAQHTVSLLCLIGLLPPTFWSTVPAAPLTLSTHDHVYDRDVIPFAGSPRDTPRDHIACGSIRSVYLRSWDTDLLRSIIPPQQVINEEAGILSVFEFLMWV